MRSSRACLFAAMLLTALGALAHAADDEPTFKVDSDEEITIDAAEIRYDQKNNTVSASGDVEIRRGETRLTADEVEVDQVRRAAAARGNAVLIDPAVTIRADEMEIDLDDETGSLSKAAIYSETRGYSLWGDRVEKRVGQSYHIENGLFTTCNCDDGPPSWSISGESLDVELDGYGDIRGGRFRILDVPVLYLPRAAFPVNRDRQSGLLFPRFGFSNRRGVQILQPVYWAINKSHDATISLDIETAQRFGLIGEYRYALSPTTHGELQGMFFNEAVRGRATGTTASGGEPVRIPENRWAALAQHSQEALGFDGYVDLLLVGDDFFLREINTFTIDEFEDVALRTQPFTTSRVGALRRWDRLYLQGEGVFYQNLSGGETYVLQAAPRAWLAGQTLLWGSLLPSVDASVVNFERGTGITGWRTRVAPSLELRLPLGRSVQGSVSAAFGETAYFLTQDQMEGGFTGEGEGYIDLPGTSNRETVELYAQVGTGINRVFSFRHFGVDKLKHTIEPRLEYLLIPLVNQDDYPIFDGIDRLAHRNVLSYGVASRLLARSAGSEDEGGDVFEVARLELMQSYDFLSDVPRARSEGDRGALSDIDVGLRVNPSENATIRFLSTYDPNNISLTSASIGLFLRQPERPLAAGEKKRLYVRSSLAIDYRFIANNAVPDTSVVEQIDTSLVLRVTDHIGLRHAARYNIGDNKLLSNFFGVRLLSKCDCWSLDFGVSDKSNPNEIQVQAQVSLVGLGSAGGGSRSGLRD